MGSNTAFKAGITQERAKPAKTGDAKSGVLGMGPDGLI